MNPPACDQVIRKAVCAVSERISFPILGVSAESPTGEIHFPNLLGGLVEGSLKPANLFLLALLYLLELGDIGHGDQHDRDLAVIFNLAGTDMPPEPTPAVCSADAMGMFDHRSLLQALP